MTLSTDTAHAKINLFLHITGRRPDGYHLLDSLAVFVGAADRVTLNGADDAATLLLSGPFSIGLRAEADNLVLRAARLFSETTGLGSAFSFDLEKNLPVASGIGGGSADAACVLRLLASRHGVPASALLPIAEKLGADVPICVEQKPARMQGVGEILLPVPPLPEIGMLLINPGIAVSTPDIFQSLAASGGVPPRQTVTLPEAWETPEHLFTLLRDTGNDLQAPAIAHAPVIGRVLEAIGQQENCQISRMSGSGATCFGLFPTPTDAIAAQTALQTGRTRPDWWSWAGALHQTVT